MKGERYYSNGFVRVYFHGKYAFVLLVYSGLCVVVAPNDDAKIHTVRSRWSRSVRYSATVLQFEIGYTKVKKKNFISIYLYI